MAANRSKTSERQANRFPEMVGNALCEIAHQAGNRSAMMSASIPFVGGAIMLTKQKLSKIADVALLSLFVLAVC